MNDLNKIKFETINSEIYVNVKDIFKFYTGENYKANTLCLSFCGVNNIKLKFGDYLLLTDFIKYFENYIPKRNEYKKKFIQILRFMRQKANSLISDEVKAFAYLDAPTESNFPRDIKSVEFIVEQLTEPADLLSLKYLFPHPDFIAGVMCNFDKEKHCLNFYSVIYNNNILDLEKDKTFLNKYKTELFVNNKLKEYGWADATCKIKEPIIFNSWIFGDYESVILNSRGKESRHIAKVEKYIKDIENLQQYLDAETENLILANNLIADLFFEFLEKKQGNTLSEFFCLNKNYFCYNEIIRHNYNINQLRKWIEKNPNISEKDFIISEILN